MQDDCSGLPHYRRCEQSLQEIKGLLEKAKQPSASAPPQ